MLSPERLRSLLHYDPETGVFTWKVARKGTAAGTICVHKRPDGYMRIGVDGRLYYAHRLAFLYMTGRWPSHYVDHVNRNPSDNRWGNLREATVSQNLANSYRGNAASGLKGAYRHKDKWRASISINGKNILLGVFATAEEAHDAYKSAAERQFGEFARTTKEDAA
jgi:hypothetical protein